MRRSHCRRCEFCARLQRSWPRVGGSGALRRSDRAISQGRCAVGVDRVSRPEVCAAQLGRRPALEEALRGVGKEVRRSHRRRSEVCARLLRSWPRVGGPGALRRGDRAISHRPLRCGRRPGLPTGSLRCTTGPTPWSRRSSTRRRQRSAAKPSPSIRILRTLINGLGLALAGQERFDEAIEQYRTGRGAVGDDRVSRPEVCAAQLGPRPGLEEALRGGAKKCGEAIAVDPNFAPAHNGLGFALAGQERFDEAIEQFRTGRRAVGERQIR